jgi:hypothetical protein
MTYFKDLSEYVYTGPAPHTKNVGWLQSGTAFARIKADSALLDALWSFCAVSIFPTRGLHPCDFCTSAIAGISERNGEKMLLGSAEIRIFSRSDEIYAAPNLIYHYVAVHDYQPPREFVDAALSGPRPDSNEYFDRLTLHGLTWSPVPRPTKESYRRFRFVKTADGVKRVYEEDPENP